MKPHHCLGLLLVASLACSPLSAKDKYPQMPDLDKQNAQTFQVQADHVREEMQKGGRYEFISDDDRAKVEAGLTFMADLIDQNGTVAAMKEDDKVRLFNRQEVVNTLLTRSDGQRIICEKADQPGSLFRATTCHTYSELQKRSRDAQNTIERTQNQRFGLMGGRAGGS